MLYFFALLRRITPFLSFRGRRSNFTSTVFLGLDDIAPFDPRRLGQTSLCCFSIGGQKGQSGKTLCIINRFASATVFWPVLCPLLVAPALFAYWPKAEEFLPPPLWLLYPNARPSIQRPPELPIYDWKESHIPLLLKNVLRCSAPDPGQRTLPPDSAGPPYEKIWAFVESYWGSCPITADIFFDPLKTVVAKRSQW